jgi:hypothetical protein
LFVGGKTNLAGDASLNSRLFVASDTSLNANLFVGGKTNLAGDASLNSRLFVGSDVSLGGYLFVSKDLSLNGNISVGSSLNIQTVNIGSGDNGILVSSILTASGGIIIPSGSNFTNNGNTLLVGVLSVTADASMNGNLLIRNNVAIGKPLSNYALDVSGVINCTGIVVGSSGETDSSGMVIAALLNASGGITVPTGSTTTLASVNTFSGPTTITGKASLTNGLTVSQDVSFNNRLFVTSDVSFSGTSYLNNISVIGTTSFPATSIAATSINNSTNTFVDTTTTQTISGNKTFTGSLYLTSDPSFSTNVVAPGNVFTGTTLVATTAYVGQAISYLVGSAPAILDTLSEIAQSLSGDANAVYDLTNLINTKVNLSGGYISGNLGVGNISIPDQGLYTFDVSGTAHISKTLFVVGDTSMNGNISVANNITTTQGNVNIINGNLNLNTSSTSFINQF